MKKKIVVGCISLIFMMLAISFATAINTNTKDEKTASPLYQLRTNQAVNKKTDQIKENIKTNFLTNRIFFIPYIYEIRNIIKPSATSGVCTPSESPGWTCTYACLTQKIANYCFK